MTTDIPVVDGLLISVEGKVATILLDREAEKNTLTRDVIIGLWDSLVSLDSNPNVRAIVIGAVGPIFSAGVALDPSSTFTDRPVAYRHKAHMLRTPIVGALSGSAVGLGLSLALQWDIRFMADDAKYGFVFVQRGVMPELGSAWLLPRIVGRGVASDLILSGRYFSGREAEKWGLAAASLPAAEVLPHAIAYAQNIAQKASPLNVGAAKRMLLRSEEIPSIGEALELDESVYEWVRSNPDPVEGVRSFLERRAPEWPSSKLDPLPEVLIVEKELSDD